MVKKYCGNNANYVGLQNGTYVIGSNYECLKKGIGVGLHLPYDKSYTGNYNPIDNRKYYCGTSIEIPENSDYFAIGSPSKCLHIGVGVGKIQNASRPRTFLTRYKTYIPYILSLVITITVFIVLYKTSPKFLSDRKIDPKNTTNYIYEMDVYKLILFSIGIFIITLILSKILFNFIKN